VASRSGLLPAGVFFVLLGGIFGAAGGVRLWEELRYREAGVHVQGAVLSKAVESASTNRSRTRYLVTYRFLTPEGAVREGADEVDPDRWEELRPGDPFEVVCLPRSPVSSRATTTTRMPLAVGFTAIGAFVLLIGGAMVVAGARGQDAP
jgi:hypothetical protein